MIKSKSGTIAPNDTKKNNLGFDARSRLVSFDEKVYKTSVEIPRWVDDQVTIVFEYQ